MAKAWEKDAPVAAWPRMENGLQKLGDRRFFFVAAAPLLVIYLVTATWSIPVNKDTFTNALTAWNLGTTGSFYLDDHADLVDLENWGWIVPAGDSAASQYPPGAPLLAVPLYAIWPTEAEAFPVVGEDGESLTGLVPPIAPASLTAALITATALGLLALVFRRLEVGDSIALVATYVAGLGTAAWSVASDQLWQHGPAMAWIALGLLLSERQMLSSGFAYGAAILTRPPLAVIPAAVGIYRAWVSRSLRPLVLVGLGAAVGLAAFIGYNSWIFGEPSLSAGYGSSFQSNVFSGGGSFGFGTGYVRNVLGGAFSFDRGLFIYSPFLILLIPGLRRGWRAAPAWARGAAVGGLVYLLLQYKANRYSGGTFFLTYRYPLEALTAAAPLLLLSYSSWVAKDPRRVRLFSVLVGLSVLLHGFGAFLTAI